jgi:predicted ATP-binding protein involved in virulence
MQHRIPSIDTIQAKIPNTNNFASINLNGKNLIITGVNGCGKTRFIDMLHQAIFNKIHGFYDERDSVKGEIQNLANSIRHSHSQSPEYLEITERIEKCKIRLEEMGPEPVSMINLEIYRNDFYSKKSILLKFEANRQAQINPPTSSRSLQTLIDESQSIADASTIFEHYLVSQKTMQAYADSPNIDNKPLEAQRIAEWFIKLDSDFKALFEDDSLCLKFNSSSQSFTINQDGKPPFSFQQLSSGFSSIISIYADLLTRIQLTATTPDDFYGIVFIDEIDAHLHVSLQRKILSFLNESFPKIQFIVTTHSPFVVSSVDDAVIYDLSSLEHVDELSMYSYDSIISGLFNTIPISKILQDKVLKLADLIKSNPADIESIQSLSFDIGEHEDKLDVESAFFLKSAKTIINKSKIGGHGV